MTVDQSHRIPAERVHPELGRLVASIPSDAFASSRATLTAHLSTLALRHVAGVGTFPGWLSLAVAPASKGLIPQPVSMSALSLGGADDFMQEELCPVG